jgi:hypothetical protein
MEQKGVAAARQPEQQLKNSEQRNGRSVLNMSCRMLLPLEYGPVAVTSH